MTTRDIRSQIDIRRILYALAIIAIVLGLFGFFSRLVAGERDVSYGSYINWGLWVAMYLFFAGLAAGSFMVASLDYLFAYDASTGRVPDWSYGALSRTWLADAEVLAFLRRHNPWALRDMAERLLEAQQRGLWNGAPDDEIVRLRQLLLESEALIESG